ncbi:MAG: hypothetical protein OHK0038_22630 [Flammeovirgaceae bacterium]
MKYWTLWLILVIGLVASCKDKNETEPIKYEVPAQVEPIVERFKEEALKRGKSLIINNLIVKLSNEPIEPSPNQFSCGITFGEITGLKQNLIQIDTQCLAWRHSEVSKEILIFHELGHAILLRHHDDSKLPNGDWKTIMTGQNWSIFDYYIFNPEKRNYYLDELFNPATPIPDWAKE